MPTFYSATNLCIPGKRSPTNITTVEMLASARLVRKEENKTPVDVKVSCLPAVVIFVHGVNSEGEWYAAADDNLCRGLNKRLNRTSILAPGIDKSLSGHRAVFDYSAANSPVIHFWWGYKSPSAEERAKYPGIDLRPGHYWGGGPFQNGTTSLLELWGDGMQDLLAFIDPQRINPLPGRSIHRAPPRWYMLHAAQRLAFLIDEIRRFNPAEAINVVCHSQGNMIGLLAQLFTARRPADTLSLNQPPYAFNAPLTVLATNDVNLGQCQTESARRQTLVNIVERISSRFQTAVAQQGALPEAAIWHSTTLKLMTGWKQKPDHERDNRGKVFLNFNVHDRVIGLSTVEGIGWQGVDSAFLRQVPAGTFYQRAYAGGEIVGSAPHSFNFDSAKVNGRFWFPKPERVKLNITRGEGLAIAAIGGAVAGGALVYNAYGDGFLDINNDPTPRTVQVNAPAVPHPVHLKKRGQKGDTLDFDKGGGTLKSEMDNDLQYAADDEPRQKVVDHHDTVQKPVFSKTDNLSWITEKVPVYRDETNAERLARVGSKPTSITDHGEILGNSTRHPIVRDVIAYDLALAPNIVQKNGPFWQYLRNLADWKVSDPYFHGLHTLTRENLPAIPREIEQQTFRTQVNYYRDRAYNAATLPARLPGMAADAAAEQARRAREGLLDAAGRAVDEAYEAGRDAVLEGAKERLKSLVPRGIPPIR